MAYDIEKNKWHPGLQVAAAQLYVPYIDQALNMLHAFKDTGHFGDKDMISEADYKPKINAFLDLLDAGGYAVQAGHLMSSGNVVTFGAKALNTLADALGVPADTLNAWMSQDVEDVLAGKSPGGYKNVIDLWGKIPHDFVQSQWLSGDQADAWVADKIGSGSDAEGATFGNDGATGGSGGSLLLWAGLLGLAALGLKGSL